MTNKFQDKKKVALPRYQQIAVAIAERIVENRYQVGQKIHARSTLASNFNVSPETARKAINVLVDLEIMDVRHGSGAYIASKEKAQAFVEQYQDVQSIQEIRQDILDSVERQQQELDNFSDLLNMLVQQTKKVHHMSPFVPFELQLTEQAQHLEKSINELNVWQATGATIIAIQTTEELLLSPGPYAKFSAGNTIYFVGNELALQRMTNFFYPTDHSA
ncbi:GntR family transcriptional regulator [Enterococcus casseliflavus]|jgi:K+/H+ antiporter YhaU regulatory subunit KhtT|uniref:GntR family transcriptional regulator n=1 Tax=Enterococcus casseliflavus TaxID=37734 RepID=UPI002542B4FC|nr:GntR family transcriptional regulator [Enterococcus casseliflavus]MDK4448797.1 GntR family transcriptional regulator [Enterococcus casseliflavus]